MDSNGYAYPGQRGFQADNLEWPYGNVDFKTTVVQQPACAKQTTAAKEKDRKPIDPPPVIKLEVSPRVDPSRQYKHSPYFFMMAYLVDEDKNSGIIHGGLTGSVSATGQTIKDRNDEHAMMFVFGDISCKREGTYRLLFCLYVLENGSCEKLASVYSQPFQCFQSKNFPGMSASTSLTRSLSDQGVRLRIRKESRSSQVRQRNNKVAAAFASHHLARDRQEREQQGRQQQMLGSIQESEDERPPKRLRNELSSPGSLNGGLAQASDVSSFTSSPLPSVSHVPGTSQAWSQTTPSQGIITSMPSSTLPNFHHTYPVVSSPQHQQRHGINTQVNHYQNSPNSVGPSFAAPQNRVPPSGSVYPPPQYENLTNSPVTPFQANGMNSNQSQFLPYAMSTTDISSPPTQHTGQSYVGQPSTGNNSPEHNYTTSTNGTVRAILDASSSYLPSGSGQRMSQPSLPALSQAVSMRPASLDLFQLPYADDVSGLQPGPGHHHGQAH